MASRAERAALAARGGNADNPREVILTPAALVTPRRVRYAVADRIPLGALTILAGWPGEGKTSLACEWVESLTRGSQDGDLRGQRVPCLFATAEDALDHALVPRLIAAEADLDRVFFVEAERAGQPDSLTLPVDAHTLGEKAEEQGAQLLVVDPLPAFLDSDAVDAHKDAEVRRALAPLAQLAEERDLAILAVHHLNKTRGGNVLARVSGSMAFTAAARSVLVLARDPDDPDGETGRQRILAHAKSNVGPLAPSLSCTVEGREVEDAEGKVIPTSRLLLGGETEHGASELLAEPPEPEERTARDEAAAFLCDLLADGPRPAKQAQREAEDAGFSKRTVERAKSLAGIGSARTNEGWCWHLPGVQP